MKNKYVFIITVVLLFLLRIFFSFLVWHPDLNNHADWGIRFFEYGPAKFYSPESNVWNFTWPNQPPGTMYMFAGVRKIFEFTFNLFWNINVKVPLFPSSIISYFETNLYPALLKLPAILADFGIAYLIYKWTGKKWASIVWLVNPVVWYNSTVWGQYDSVINFFALASFYLLNRKNLTWSALALALSLYIKASLLIFVPVWVVFAVVQKYRIRDYIFTLFASFAFISIITLPFSSGNPILWLFNLYQYKIFVQQLHFITANAFNLWAGLTTIYEKSDSLILMGLTFQTWGFVLYALAYTPLLINTSKVVNTKNIIWILSLVSFGSFMLLTNMHERYIYPLFPYLTILLASGYIKKWYYITISLISLLGMYHLWFTPRIEPIVIFLSFGDRIMPRILGFVMFAMFLKLYWRYNEIK